MNVIGQVEVTENQTFYIDGTQIVLKAGTVVDWLEPTEHETVKLKSDFDQERTFRGDSLPWVVVEWMGGRRRLSGRVIQRVAQPQDGR